MGVVKMVVRTVRQGVRYGPVVAAVSGEARGPVTDYAKATLDASRQRRLAVREAATLRDGTVLAVVHGDRMVWVVFTGDSPLSVHPEIGVPPAALVEHANLDLRRRPDQFPSPGQRLGRFRRRVVKVPRRRRPPALPATPDVSGDPQQTGS